MLPAMHANLVTEAFDTTQVVRILPGAPALHKTGSANVTTRKQIEQGRVTLFERRVGPGRTWSRDDVALQIGCIAEIIEGKTDESRHAVWLR